MKKEKRILTRKDYETIYNAVHNKLDYAREEDITVSEINFLVGYTGLDLQVILDYLFCNYEIEKEITLQEAVENQLKRLNEYEDVYDAYDKAMKIANEI